MADVAPQISHTGDGADLLESRGALASVGVEADRGAVAALGSPLDGVGLAGGDDLVHGRGGERVEPRGLRQGRAGEGEYGGDGELHLDGGCGLIVRRGVLKNIKAGRSWW